MPKILCIETATEVCSVSISENGKLLAIAENHEGNAHASQLHILVQQALDKSNLLLKDLDAVAVSKGPGSYTGLRVGVSAAKGYCYALDIPMIAINTLESLVASRIEPIANNQQSMYLVPMLDARRMEVYCAVFDSHGLMISATEAKIIDEHSFAELLAQGNVYFMGNGAAKCKGVIQHKNAVFVDDVKCSAEGMISLANDAYIHKLFEDAAYFEPFYLKDFVGTTPKKLV